MESRSDSKRLAKNTIVLYMRTLAMMLIGFYTSRVVLNALGIENYGIRNVVGGFVAMFAVVQTTLSSATSRFMTFELGKSENSNPQKVFGVVMTIHIALAIFMILLLETIGIYFLNNGLNIPENRMWAANWVFHISVVSMAIGILNSPYIGLVISHEKMDAFAYMSLFDVCTKLGICYLLYITPYDRLVTYSVFYLCTGIIGVIIYNLYSRRKFHESKYIFVKDKTQYKEIFKFAGLNFAGGLASMLSNQGTNILINLFYGVTLNAAMGIANQVKGISTKFVGDFVMALKPQITKEYADGNILRSMELTFRGSKFSYFLTLILAVPIIARTSYILEFWLKIFPPEAVLFSQLTIIYTLLVLLSNTLVTEIHATGDVKDANIWIGGLRLMILPIEYLALLIFNISYIVLVVQIVMEILSLFVRLKILNKITHIDHLSVFNKTVILPIALVTVPSALVAYICNKFIPNNFIGLCLFSGISMTVCCCCILKFGLSQSERTTMISIAKRKLGKIFPAFNR